MKAKVGYGAKEDLAKAIEDLKVDPGDIIATSDTEEIGFIKPDNTVMYFKSRAPVFDSFELAQEYVNSDSETKYAGQPIKVKLDDGKYHNYTLQPSDDGSFILEEDQKAISVVEFL